MPAREFETVLYREEGAVGWITLNRPEQGNMFNAVMLAELRTVLEDTRLETRTRVLVLTGAGDRFFCLGGDKEGLAETYGWVERQVRSIAGSGSGVGHAAAQR